MSFPYTRGSSRFLLLSFGGQCPSPCFFFFPLSALHHPCNPFLCESPSTEIMFPEWNLLGFLTFVNEGVWCQGYGLKIRGGLRACGGVTRWQDGEGRGPQGENGMETHLPSFGNRVQGQGGKWGKCPSQGGQELVLKVLKPTSPRVFPCAT